MPSIVNKCSKIEDGIGGGLESLDCGAGSSQFQVLLNALWRCQVCLDELIRCCILISQTRRRVSIFGLRREKDKISSQRNLRSSLPP
jgi:hypothetical protein